jgi:long-chain fatty acid transport protein
MVLASTVLGASSRDASAAGFASARFGGEQGSVVATNPTALYFNPGAIGFSEGIHIYLDGDIALRDASWAHTAPAAPGNTQYGNSGTAHLFNVFAGPAVGMTIEVGNLVVGAGLFVPFGGRVDFPQNASIPTSSPAASEPHASNLCASQAVCPLAANGVQRWHIETASLTFVHAALGAAYRFGPVSIGATGNFINSRIAETQDHTLNGPIDSTMEDAASLSVSGNDLSFAAGVMVEAIPDHLWIGGSYQAQPGVGPQTLKGTLAYTSGAPPYYQSQGNTIYPVDFHESLPDIFRAGVRARVSDRLELRVFGDYTRWSNMTSQCINNTDGGDACQVYGAGGDAAHPLGGDATPKGSTLAYVPRNWNDTFGVRLGVSYWPKPELELFAGVGYETAAVPDSTLEPGAMDANNFAGALGGRFKVSRGLYLAASYTHIQFEDRTVTNSQLAVSNGVAVAFPEIQQDGNGKYTQWIGIIDVNAEKTF